MLVNRLHSCCTVSSSSKVNFSKFHALSCFTGYIGEPSSLSSSSALRRALTAVRSTMCSKVSIDPRPTKSVKERSRLDALGTKVLHLKQTWRALIWSWRVICRKRASRQRSGRIEKGAMVRGGGG